MCRAVALAVRFFPEGELHECSGPGLRGKSSTLPVTLNFGTSFGIVLSSLLKTLATCIEYHEFRLPLSV